MSFLNENEEILQFYNGGAEIGRLERGIGPLEFERTKELISRYLQKEKQVIYDIGGGIGIYSNWLAALGHEVHLFELAPNAVSYAKEKNGFIKEIEVADARCINRPDNSADIVLLMGPLYHLTEQEERLKAIIEAKRMLKHNGILIVTTITKFSTTLWALSVLGTKNEFLFEDVFSQMINEELTSGQHIRPMEYSNFIARSFFHTPELLQQELLIAGLSHEKTYAIEGPVWMVPKFQAYWEQTNDREKLLNIVRKTEEEASLLGMSPHILAIAKK